MERKKSWLRKDFDALRVQWDMLTFYERFEQLVTHVLSVAISIIILVSLWQLIRAVISLLVSAVVNVVVASLQANCFSSSGCMRSGLSQTSSFNSQLRVDRDQRRGLRCLASA